MFTSQANVLIFHWFTVNTFRVINVSDMSFWKRDIIIRVYAYMLFSQFV